MKNKLTALSIITLLCFSLAGSLSADWVNVPASAFHQGDESMEASYLLSNDGGYVYCPHQSACLYATVLLPDGALLKEIEFTYYDDHLEDFTVNLVRKNIFNGDEVVLFSRVTVGAIDSVHKIADRSISPAPSYARVYNNACEYYVSICLPAGTDTRLYGVAIRYD